MTPILPQWNKGIVLEALSKALTLKTVFPLPMASAGRRSELQASVFDPQYIQFKRVGVTLYFSPEFMLAEKSET